MQIKIFPHITCYKIAFWPSCLYLVYVWNTSGTMTSCFIFNHAFSSVKWQKAWRTDLIFTCTCGNEMVLFLLRHKMQLPRALHNYCLSLVETFVQEHVKNSQVEHHEAPGLQLHCALRALFLQSAGSQERVQHKAHWSELRRFVLQ